MQPRVNESSTCTDTKERSKHRADSLFYSFCMYLSCPIPRPPPPCILPRNALFLLFSRGRLFLFLYFLSPFLFLFLSLFLIESRRLGHSSVYDRLQSNSLVNSITWRDGCFNLMEQRLTIEILFYWSRCAFLAILHVYTYIYRLHVIMMDSYFIRVVLIVESF